MPKRVKIFTSKWHRKQQHFSHNLLDHSNAFSLSRRIFCREQAYQSLSYVRKGGGVEFSTMPPSGAPWNFDWTKLAHAQLGYGAYNIRP